MLGNVLLWDFLFHSSSKPSAFNQWCRYAFLSDQHRDLIVPVYNKLTWPTTLTKFALRHIILFTWFTALWSLPLQFGKQPYTHIYIYISLVWSNLAYCSQLWMPVLAKDIQSLEQFQCGATKYILQDYSLDYESRLVSLNVLPLMYWLELQDLAFFVKSIKYPTMLPLFLQTHNLPLPTNYAKNPIKHL